jgi:hypothetical protein
VSPKLLDKAIEQQAQEEEEVAPFLNMSVGNSELDAELQRKVDQHVSSCCHPPAKKRHIVRHWRLDSRKSLTKSKKKALKYEFRVTPFLLIGAYQSLLERATQHDSSSTQAIRDAILDTNLPFTWFQTTAQKLEQRDLDLRDFGKAKHESCKMLILHETMAMVMRPVLEPYLPSHAWCLDEHFVPTAFLQDQVELVARKTFDHDSSQHSFLFWNLTANEKNYNHMALSALQLRMIVNMVHPYVPGWWTETLFKLFHIHARGPTKKLKTWLLTEDEISSLPAILTDIFLLRLDFSETLEKHPLWRHMQQLTASDRKKQKGGILADSERNLPKKYRDSNAHLDCVRVGPAVMVAYKGPNELQEKVCKAVSMELKSGLLFDKKFIDNQAFVMKKGRVKNKPEKAEAEAVYVKQKKIFDIQEEGRVLRERRDN